MAANPKSPMEIIPVEEASYHIYHAEAELLSGRLEYPINQPIENFGRAVLENTRRENLITRYVGETSIEGLISFKSGHTRVSGTQLQQKTDYLGSDESGWATLSTAVIEGLNVLDMITCDRVVAQVSTSHPPQDGSVPTVTFLGSRFENLRVAGYPVQVELNLEICGNKPSADRPYIEDTGFLDRVHDQLKSAKKRAQDLPETIEKRYDADIAYVASLKQRAIESASTGAANDDRKGSSKLRCTLIKIIEPIPIPGVKIFGNTIFIPNFGAVSLAEVEVGVTEGCSAFSDKPRVVSESEPGNSNYFTLNMFHLHLGSPSGGQIKGPTSTANGQGSGPGSK